MARDNDGLQPLPIMGELGDGLAAAFRAEEAAQARHQSVARIRRWLLPVATVATVAVIAGLLALTLGVDDGSVSQTPASAAQVLRRTAQAAEHHVVTPFPRDQQFFYLSSTATNLVVGQPMSVDTIRLVTKARMIWTSIARTGRLEERLLGTQATPGASTAGSSPVHGDPLTTPARDLSPSGAYHLGGFRLSPEALTAFPTDPRTIYNRLLGDVGDRGNSAQREVFTEIGDALRESPAPAALRAGLYGALAIVPGVQLQPQATDSAGRSGTAVFVTEAGVRHELLFDPATSEMLAERDVLVSPADAQLPLAIGTVIGETTYLERAVTNTINRPSR